jgi:lipid-A-disaccharide synthase-like uncharacterized protein
VLLEARPPLAPLLVATGLLGQGCFFTRFLLQWLASERAGRSVVPRAFWWLTLGGSLLMISYAVERREPVFLLGYLVGATIATRNLVLALRERRSRVPLRCLALVAVLFLAILLEAELRASPFASDQPLVWLVLGTVGQTLWVGRFPLQWLLSEQRGESHFPRAFWWLSLIGNGLLLAYALHLRDPLFVLGFLPGPFVQVRNLLLARHGSREERLA